VFDCHDSLSLVRHPTFLSLIQLTHGPLSFFLAAPPSNQTEFNEWTLGPVYYSALVIAEAFGKTNTSQIIDLRANENNQNTPGYAIFERGQLSKVALFNYIDDPSGANDLNVALTVNGGVPASVNVKYVFLFLERSGCVLGGIYADGWFIYRYLEGISVNEKNNITWAGQVRTHTSYHSTFPLTID
jgi:hypothetical protein